MKNKRLYLIFGIITGILCLPAIAMQFTDEVNWTTSDFVIMATLLLVTGLSIEFALRKITNLRYRFLAAAVILFVFFLIWAELAVGIFGTPFAGS